MRTRETGQEEKQAAAPPWHALPAEEVLARVGASLGGLTPDEAARRLADHGTNRLPAARPRSGLARFLSQFNNLLIYVLLGAAAVAALLGHGTDTAVILGVVLANAAIGFVQEGRAAAALDAIRGMVDPLVSVVREGRRCTVAADDLVPGDIVLLAPGDRVSADLRLLRARNLRIEEAALTGESVPVEKAPEAVAAADPLGDRRCMAYSGTMVVAGQGQGVVIATGLATELGRVSRLLGSVESMTTPLLRQMDAFARRLTAVILGACAAVFGVAVLARGYAPADAFMAMVGLAVAAIPEGLPAVMTITLAIGVRRMAARHAIIRRLPAVETLGSVSVICSDKTGTLTRNEMMVASVALPDATATVTGEGYAPRGGFLLAGAEIDPEAVPGLADIARAATLCNDATLREEGRDWQVEGDPMEGALIALAMKAGLDPATVAGAFPRGDEIPFDAAHRFMATLHHGHDGGALVYLKGAPEAVFPRCRDTGGVPLDAAAWAARTDALAAGGQRVLALAVKRVPADVRGLTFADVAEGLTLLGLVGLIDPPRPEAIAAVADCRAAGIGVKMITGDHAATAAAIARLLGLDDGARVITGAELDALDDDALASRAREVNVFARTSPEHKLRLVQALQAEGAVVAMTGDGVNDAPALKRADVGVAMGRRGTEAAKESAEMVLADDNFASIVAAVREGRTIYDNLIKVIAWTLPTNGGEACAIIAAILLGLTLPLTAVQILWINMVTAVTLGLVLAFEPTEPDAMRRPPRDARQALLTPFLAWRVLLVSALFMVGVFGVFNAALARGLDLEAARTLVVNTLVAMEIAYLFNVRFLRGRSLTWRGVVGTPAVLLGVGGVLLAQLCFTYLPPLHDLFETRPLGFAEGVAALGAGVLLFLALELEKTLLRLLRR